MATPSTRGRLGELPPEPGRRTIPFDYAFRFELAGQPELKHSQTVTVSVEAAFIAEAIGYGFVPGLRAEGRLGVPNITFGPTKEQTDEAFTVLGLKPPEYPPPLSSLPLGALLAALEASVPETVVSLRGKTGVEGLLKAGIRLNPAVAEAALAEFDSDEPPPLAASVVQNLFQLVGTSPEEIHFLYALFDDGSGREFQSQPLLNTAGLGISNGDRPFRRFAQPIRFEPQATIRMEITELSTLQGFVHVSLQGYKVLGAPGSPTATTRRAPRARARARRR